MYKFPHQQVKHIRDNGATNVLEEIVEAGRKGYCNLYQNHPGWVFMKNNFTLPIVKRILDDVCDDGSFTPPELPEAEYTGGQCETLYHAFGTYKQKRTINCNGLAYWRTSISLNGQDVASFVPVEGVGGYVVIEMKDGTVAHLREMNKNLYDARDLYNSGSLRMIYVPSNNPCVNSTSSHGADFNIVEVVRVDGQPDNCGDPEVDWYDDPPPTDSELTQDIDITNAYGDTYTYNVTVNRDPGGLIRFSPTLNVNRVGISIDVGGITAGGRDPDSGSKGEEEAPDLAPPPETSDEQPEIEAPPAIVEETLPGEIVKTGINGLTKVMISVTNIPSNASMSSGHGSPTKIYAGWLEFSLDGDYFERQFIDFEDMVFLPPVGANGYAVCLKPGYNADIYYSFLTIE